MRLQGSMSTLSRAPFAKYFRSVLAAQIPEDGGHAIEEALAKIGVGEGRCMVHRRHPLRRRLVRQEVCRMLRSPPPFHTLSQDPPAT